MPQLSQKDRPIRIDTSLGEDVLLLAGMSGVEGVSMPFAFQVDLLSEDPAIAADKLLRTPVVITIRLADGGERTIHGLVRRFVQLGQVEELTSYQAEVVPWLWFLSLSRDCKIFQDLTVPEIVEQVFKSQGHSDFKLKCTRSYRKREYCVQYRETHLDFVSRLLEEEGIFYYFEHSDSKHELVLSDSNSSFRPCPGGDTARSAPDHGVRDDDVVTTLRQEQSVHVGTVTLTDYDYLQPTLNLESSIAGDGREEQYDYPGAYASRGDGDGYARSRLEAEEAGAKQVGGESTCRAFASGYKFTLEGHYRKDANGEYIITRVTHRVSSGDYRSGRSTEFDYRNEFTAIPSQVPFRPPQRTRRPVVHGSQTAVVVGKSGEEIWVDKYGRVKIQFHWDRDGKKDENSSCWVRVSSTWAGKGWGAIHIPRIGQEVVVGFLEGDPDRPIITGSVYNADQMPPYALPANQTQSGIRSRSSKKGGAENFNEIRFEDKKDEELLAIHAQKDQQIVVENDRSDSVGNNESITIGQNRTESVGQDEKIEIGRDRSETVKRDESVAVERDRGVTIAANDGLEVGADQKQSVGGSQTVTIGGARDLSVGKSEQHEVGAKRTTQIGTDDVLTVGGDHTIEVQQGNQKITIKLGDQTTNAKLGKIAQQALQGIELKVGQNSIKIDQTGITIKGMMVKIEGQIQTEVKGLMTQINGTAVLKAQGGITMIN